MMPRSYYSRPYASKRFDQDFIDRVEAVLKQHSGARVDRMEVDHVPLSNRNADYIDRWLGFAIATKTKHLIFDFTPLRATGATDEPYRFPLEIFSATNSSRLQSMKLGGVSLKQPENFKGFLNIKKLELKCVDITDEQLQLLLPKCHVLEFLGMSLCRRLTSIQTSHPSSHLKHLQVSHCPLVQEIKLNLGLKTLEYQGSLVPLAPPGTLTGLCINSSDVSSALVYIFNGLPSTLPCLETLTLKCEELERASLPDKPTKFIYLRHLRLELIFPSKFKADVLDFACLLEAAPLLEKLEFHMWMDMWAHDRFRYRKRHGKLRSLPSHPHSHLKLVNVTGFYGLKDQLELLLHFLRNSTVLKAMRIEPKPMVAARYLYLSPGDALSSLDGYKVAKKYLRKEDHRGVVQIVRVRRDVVNAPYYHLIDPQRFPMLPEAN
ncbi:hypothetical protein E2562_035506 [Oryza meyeriana var. granulata]|nr:hypothetical protein E2562_035506 [Oryza meyeriana var. granulata]